MQDQYGRSRIRRALILGRAIGMTDGEVVKSMSSSLFVTLTGIMFRFAAINETGALKLVSNKLVSLIGKRIWLIPIVSYLLGFILSAIGQGAIPPPTLVVTITVCIAVSAGYNPIMIGLTAGVILPVFAFQVITTVLPAIALFFIFKGHKVTADGKTIEVEHEKANVKQILALLSIVALLVMVVVFGFDVGLTSFIIAAVLLVFNIVDDRAALKAVPLGTITMILGVGTLMSVISKAGGIDLLSSIMSPGTVGRVPRFGLGAS